MYIQHLLYNKYKPPKNSVVISFFGIPPYSKTQV